MESSELELELDPSGFTVDAAGLELESSELELDPSELTVESTKLELDPSPNVVVSPEEAGVIAADVGSYTVPVRGASGRKHCVSTDRRAIVSDTGKIKTRLACFESIMYD